MVYYNICQWNVLLLLLVGHAKPTFFIELMRLYKQKLSFFIHQEWDKCAWCRLMQNVLSRIIWSKTRKSLLIVSQQHHLLAAWTVLWFVFTNMYGMSMFPCKVIYCRRSFSRLSNIVHSSYFILFFTAHSFFKELVREYNDNKRHSCILSLVLRE